MMGLLIARMIFALVTLNTSFFCSSVGVVVVHAAVVAANNLTAQWGLCVSVGTREQVSVAGVSDSHGNRVSNATGIVTTLTTTLTPNASTTVLLGFDAAGEQRADDNSAKIFRGDDASTGPVPNGRANSSIPAVVSCR